LNTPPRFTLQENSNFKLTAKIKLCYNFPGSGSKIWDESRAEELGVGCMISKENQIKSYEMCNEMITRTAKSSNACNSVEVSSAK
jgi:hypothetical protein